MHLWDESPIQDLFLDGLIEDKKEKKKLTKFFFFF